MASIFRDPKSPFWQLRFKNREGRWRSKSLRPFRHGTPIDTRRARAIMDAHSLDEHSRSPQRDTWNSWVPAYLQSRYIASPGTLKRTEQAWARLREYLEEINAPAPQDLTYRACMDYMAWRTKSQLSVVPTLRFRHRRPAAHNTARLELVLLSMLCTEAIRRGIISRNPAARLGIPRLREKEKPELTDEHIAAIRQALKTEPDWMGYAFEIALHQGCRLMETALFRSDIDINAGKIHFRLTKGDKPFTVPLHPALKPILQDLLGRSVSANQERVFFLPPQASCNFFRFFQKLGIPGLTFHCTRVSVASRLARAGYPISKACRLLNHGSELVHRTYQRLQAQDVGDAFQFLGFQEGYTPDKS